MITHEIYQCTVHYCGRVQGVGFRYQVLQIAKEFDVSGHVRNLVDGRVQLEAEGDPEEVQAFVREVEDRLDMYIRTTERVEGSQAPRHKGFIIC